MNTQDKQEDRGIFALFKGPSGSGKTVGAISFPNPGVLDFDRKMPAVALKHFPKKPIEYWQFESLSDCTNLIDGWITQNNCPVETVIIDSTTTIAKFIITCLSELVGETTSVQLRSVRKTKTGQDMMEAINIGIYNHELKFFMYLIDSMKLLWMRPGNPRNVIFIAHVLTVEFGKELKTGIITKTRSIVTAGRKAAAYIPMEFDNVFQFGFKEEGGLEGDSEIKHIMISQTIGDDDAKCAYNLTKITDFTNKSLYDEIQMQLRGYDFANS
jgi:hypothetical protein